MSSFNEAIERMKSLYTYGNVNEDKQHSNYTIEYHQTGADGKSYGIIRECNKYYIKSAPESKALIAEAYEYLGGFSNRKNYEYTSYNNALKNFELKMASIKEAVRGDVVIENVDDFKKKSQLLESSDIMQREIARQRQIMYNASMIMNESVEIGASRKNDVVMYDKENPEAPKGGNTEPKGKDAKADPDYTGSKTNGLDKDVTPFDKKATVKEGCECECGEKGDWGSEGMCKGEDPKKIGWDIEGQQTVNEEENDWGSEGLPSSAGVGEADTDHNNNPFTNLVNEDVDDFEDTEEIDNNDDEGDGEEIVDLGIEGGDETEDEEPVEDFEDEEGSEEGDIELNDEPAESDEDSLDDSNEEWEDLDVDDEDGDELEVTLDDEEGTEDFDGDEPNGEEFSDDTEITSDGDDVEIDDTEIEEPENDELDDVLDNDEYTEDFEDEDGIVDECGDMNLYESKRYAMNKIVNMVVNEILNEDTLHVFGKHPGYRKKPMELPTTGSDKNEWGEDWNDESVHSEEPFGSKIGDGKPFDKLVDAVTSVVMEQLKIGKKKMK